LICRRKLIRDGHPVLSDYPELPAAILEQVKPIYQPGDTLNRMITDEGEEWWLIDADGELIEAFWLEK